MISVGSIAAAASLPFLMLWLYPRDWFQLAFGIVACAMAILKHRKNIERIRTGSEPRVRLFGRGAAVNTEPRTPGDTTGDAGH